MKNFKNPAWKEQVSKVIQQTQEQDIKFVRLQFTDINGMLKNLAINSKNLESIFDNGQSFDGSSITGYRPIVVAAGIQFDHARQFNALAPFGDDHMQTARFTLRAQRRGEQAYFILDKGIAYVYTR